MSVDMKMSPADAVLELERIYRSLSDRLAAEKKALEMQLRELQSMDIPSQVGRDADMALSIDGHVPYDNPDNVTMMISGQVIGHCGMLKPIPKGKYRFLVYGYKLNG